jgi:VanZ family protein
MGAGLALLDELFQGTVGRQRSAADWITDVLAVSTAVAVDAWERRRRPAPHWMWRRNAAERKADG